MHNPMTIRNEQVIGVSEWDAFVKQTYGRPYSFQQQDGCQSRGVFRFSVPDAAEDYERESVPEVVNGPEEASVSRHGYREIQSKSSQTRMTKMTTASICGGIGTSTQTFRWWQTTSTQRGF